MPEYLCVCVSASVAMTAQLKQQAAQLASLGVAKREIFVFLCVLP